MCSSDLNSRDKRPDITIKGSGNDTIISNTRLFSRGNDSGSPALGFSLTDLLLQYGSGQSGYILSSSRGSVPYNPLSPTATGYSIRRVGFSGQHKGVVGANGTYIDVTGSKDTLIDQISVTLTGQDSYDPLTGLGGGYFLFFEGGVNLQVLNSSFDEKGFSSSIAILFSNDAKIEGNQIGRAHV